VLAIIIKVSPYKEKSAIISALGDSETISFLAKRVLDNKSPYYFLNNPFVVVDLSFSDTKNYQYKVLSEAKLIFSPLNLNFKIEDTLSLMCLNELINKLVPDSDKPALFNDLYSCLQEIKKEGTNHYNTIFYFLAKVLTNQGYSFEVNECIHCGKKKEIVSFSFLDGGYVCRDCLENGLIETTYSIVELKFIRNIFLANKVEDINLSLTKDEYHHLIKYFSLFIKENFGCSLASFANLTKLN